jgi:hypothetical protein
MSLVLTSYLPLRLGHPVRPLTIYSSRSARYWSDWLWGMVAGLQYADYGRLAGALWHAHFSAWPFCCLFLHSAFVVGGHRRSRDLEEWGSYLSHPYGVTAQLSLTKFATLSF